MRIIKKPKFAVITCKFCGCKYKPQLKDLKDELRCNIPAVYCKYCKTRSDVVFINAKKEVESEGISYDK